MRANARRRKGFAHSLTAGQHTLTADEPAEKGGTDTGPSPTQLLALSLAGCTAITIEMYAERKGWDLRAVEVDVDYELHPSKGIASFAVVLKLPESLSEAQAEQLLVIAHKCPVHRTLQGEVAISDRVERVAQGA